MSAYRSLMDRRIDPFWDNWQRDIDYEEEIEDQRLPRQTLTDRENPLELLNDTKFRQVFGFSKQGFLYVLDLVLPRIQQTPTRHKEYLTPIQKLAIFLDFLRTNAFQRTIGTQHHNQISQGRCCVVINQMSRMIADLHPQFVKMPTPEEAEEISNEIFQRTGFPFTQGIIDGTHIEILRPIGFQRRRLHQGPPINQPGQAANQPGQAVNQPGGAPDQPRQALNQPGEAMNPPGQAANQPGLAANQPGQAANQPHADKFYNRKGYFSLNCMVVTDNKYQIRHFTACNVGSAHDARCFNESELRAKLEREFNPNKPLILIGDEGYGCSQVLVTPIREDRVVTPNQANFNKALCRARLTVEHTFGQLKKRFPALLYQSRCRNLQNLQAIIAAAITLHNITLSINEEAPILPPYIREQTYQEQLRRAQILIQPRGRQEERNFVMRNRIIGSFF